MMSAAAGAGSPFRTGVVPGQPMAVVPIISTTVSAGGWVGPAVVGIDRGRRAIGDRIAEGHDGARIGWSVDHDFAQEDPRGDRLCSLEIRLAHEAAFARDVGRLHALPVEGRG